jgi:phosphate transport system substrate-binding protein
MNGNDGLSRRAALVAIAAPAAMIALSGRVARAQEAAPPTTPPATPPTTPDPLDVDRTPYPAFVADESITGTVRCVGSSSVGLVLNAMRPGFREDQPSITIEVVSSGSGTAPKALASGEADIAPMSRAMRPSEIAEIEKARKGTVDFVDLAIDAIAIGVHTRNPLRTITLKDLDRVFGRERRRGGAPALKWSDIGVRDGVLDDRTITLFGMGSGSGSNGLVQEVVLQGGPFRTVVNSEPVSSSVIQAIATDPESMGYCSVVFESARVRQLSVEALDGSGFVAPTEEAIRSGRYPLARALRLYFVRESLERKPAIRKLLQFAVSQDGQEIVGLGGQKTLSPAAARACFAKVQ